MDPDTLNSLMEVTNKVSVVVMESHIKAAGFRVSEWICYFEVIQAAIAAEDYTLDRYINHISKIITCQWVIQRRGRLEHQIYS